MKNSFDSRTIVLLIQFAAWVFVPVAAYAILLTAGIPTSLGEGFAKGYALPAAAAGLVAVLLRTGSVLRLGGALSVVLLWFGAPLAWHWTSGAGDGMIVGGLLPFSDASGYLSGADSVVHGGRLSMQSSTRPLFPSMLSSVLFLSRSNLQVTLAVLVALTTYALFLATVEIRARLGMVTATVFLLVTFLFFRRFAGTPMTEHLGLAASATGLALLIRGAATRGAPLLHSGVFFVSLALCARAGALFTLPLLVLWVALILRKERRIPYGSFMIACASVLAAFALNALVGKVAGATEGRPFSNYAHTAYGIVTGGTWEDAKNEYGNDTGAMIRAVEEHVKADPMSLWRGATRAWAAFFSQAYLYSFIGSSALRLCLTLLTGMGLCSALVRYSRQPLASLLVLTAAGVLASVPFVPPWDADSMRAYAATIPFQALLAGIGAGSIIPLVRSLREKRLELGFDYESHEEAATNPLVFGIVLLTLCSLIPLLLRASLSRFEDSAVRKGEITITPGSSIHLVEDTRTDVRSPYLRVSDFRASIASFAGLYEREAAALRNIPAGHTISYPWITNGFAVQKTKRTPVAPARIRTGATVKVGYMRLYLEEGVNLLAEPETTTGVGSARSSSSE